MKSITLQPILTESFISCPFCHVPIIRMTDKTETYIGEMPWLHDGDTIPGLWERLSDGQKTPYGFDYSLYVGYQRCCGKDYYIVEATFIGADIISANDDFDPVAWMNQNLFNTRSGTFRFCTANYSGNNPKIPKTWNVTEVQTEYGIAHHHTFGPFKLEEQSLIGNHGVACCQSGGRDTWAFASDLLYELWDDLRAGVGIDAPKVSAGQPAGGYRNGVEHGA